MKLTLKSLVVLALAGVLLTYSGCKKHPETPVPITDTQITALSKTWKVISVTRDATDETTDYASFQLTLSGTLGTQIVNYSCSARPSLSAWPASGSFTFSTTTPTTNLTRDASGADPIPVVYSVSSAQLILTFTYNGAGYSRTDEVTGAWVFTLAPL
jgi:hypothetical protein